MELTHRKLAILAAGAAMLMASCAGPGHAELARARPCAASALRVSFSASLSLYTSHVVRTLVFGNRSRAACTLNGYPAVAFVATRDGRQIGAAAGRTVRPARRVLLPPGSRALATLLLTDAYAFGAACARRATWGVRVIPPGQRTARLLHLQGLTCAGRRPVVMAVSPVRLAG